MTIKMEFQKSTTASAFLNLLGVNYGFTIATGNQPILIFDLESAKEGNLHLQKEGAFSAEDVQAAEKAMVEAGLENLTDMFNKVQQFPIPTDFSPMLLFKRCNNPNCKNPLAHGYICNPDGTRAVEKSFNTLNDGLNFCEMLAEGAQPAQFNAVTLFRQMLDADLAGDEDDWMVRYNALPEETRRKCEEAAFGGATVVIVD